MLAELATKSHLLRLLDGDRRPALLVVAAHGIAYPKSDARQYDEQGAIVCSDWDGTSPLKGAEYLAGRDVPEDASLLGMIMFMVGDFGAGTPKLENRVTDGSPRELADRAFVSRLSQRLLGHSRGGALAVIGHVDVSWMPTFQQFQRVPGGAEQWKSEGSDTFVGTVSRLVRGFTVGSAMDFFNARYAQAAAELVDRLLNQTFYGGRTGKRDRDRLINEAIDVRNYIVLGDPAVRLPVEGPVPEQAASISVDRTVIAAIDAALTPPTERPGGPPGRTTTEQPGVTGEMAIVESEQVVAAEPPFVDTDVGGPGGRALVVFNGIDFESGRYAYPTPSLAALAKSIVSGPIDADRATSPGQSDYRTAAASTSSMGSNAWHYRRASTRTTCHRPVGG